MFNYNDVIHPSEHGGGNRFHLISPIPNQDKSLREIGASTGGGEFLQHNDATVFTDLKNETDIFQRLKFLNTDLETVSEKTNKSIQNIIDEITCQKYVKVDALILKGIINKNTKTKISTTKMIQKYLHDELFTLKELKSLSQMPIAHIAGPADGEISGFIGEITSPISLDTSNNVIGIYINLAKDRMLYVGKDDAERKLFTRFVTSMHTVPTTDVLIKSSDLLFIPNNYYTGQSNATHGRGRLNDDEYKIEVAKNKYVRRMHCRQYLSNRYQDNLNSHMKELLNGI